MCLKENILEGLYVLTNLSAGRQSLGLGYYTSCFNTSARPTSCTACAPSAPASPAPVKYNWERRNCYYPQFKMYVDQGKSEIWKMMLLSNPSTLIFL